MQDTPVFTYKQFQSMLESFAVRVPAILSRMPETSHLTAKFDSLLEQGSTPFTVAVMGQMRSGKSTLLNALIGRDLAVTGVNETTATVNCFKFSENEEDCARFRVLWKDAPEQSLPISQIDRWIGDSEHAARTSRLEFYAPSAFLKTANIIDTPGTRSSIADHTSALSDFLHHESVRQGGKADAIIYVLLPVGRENDEKWLAEFEDSSRMPGATPYNSIAVVHKWEATLDVGDPAHTAAAKAAKIHSMLTGRVSSVIAVSAPLAIVADRLSADRGFWESLLALGRHSTPEALDMITMQEEYYTSEIDGCSMTSAERERLRGRVQEAYPGLPWPSFKILVRTAASAAVQSPAALQRKISDLSGFDALKRELEDRYFARASVIKAFSLMAKAWKPCQTAQTLLRNLKGELDQTIREGDEVLKVLDSRRQSDASLDSAANYIRKSKVTLEARFREAQTALAEIGDAINPVQTAFEDMESEFSALEILEKRSAEYPDGIGTRLRFLLGGHGTEMEVRMKAIIVDSPSIDDFNNLCGQLRVVRAALPADLRKPLDIAMIRAEQIADWLETR